jgi:hypothetical protein
MGLKDAFRSLVGLHCRRVQDFSDSFSTSFWRFLNVLVCDQPLEAYFSPVIAYSVRHND